MVVLAKQNCVRVRGVEPWDNAPRTPVQSTNTDCWTIHPKPHNHMVDKPGSSVPNSTEQFAKNFFFFLCLLLLLLLLLIIYWIICLCSLHKPAHNGTRLRIYSGISNFKWNFTVKVGKIIPLTMLGNVFHDSSSSAEKKIWNLKVYV